MIVNGKKTLVSVISALSVIGLAHGAQAQEFGIDGSSTVFPITEAAVSAYIEGDAELGVPSAVAPDARITVGVSGTGGGFRKFCAGETVISNASRPIKPEEAQACADAGIEFVEVAIATDALTVVIHPDNDWATELTIEQLTAMWEPAAQGTVDNWNQIPGISKDAPLVLYGPGTDSGTFDYFNEVVNDATDGDSRADYTASEDDFVLVTGVEGDVNALGYFGYAYYLEAGQLLQAVAIENSEGEFVLPSAETVESGAYEPLSRPLFLYVNTAALADEDTGVMDFVAFYLENAQSLVESVGYITRDDYDEQLADLMEAAEEVAAGL